MAGIEISYQIICGGTTIYGRYNRVGEGYWAEEGSEQLPAARAAVVAAQTDTDGGDLTCPIDHGLTTNDRISMWWTGDDGVLCRQKGVISAVDGAEVSVAFGIEGADFPEEETDVWYAKEVEIELSLVGNNLVAIAASAELLAAAYFEAAGGTVLKALQLPAKEPWIWTDSGGVDAPNTANPLAGVTMAKAWAANGSTALANTLRLATVRS